MKLFLQKHQHTFVLLAFIALKFGLHGIIINPLYELHRDEYLHLNQGQHLAWGYLSVPPVTSWISLLILWLGNSIFWVKFFPALFGAITLFFVWKITEILGGNLFAKSLAVVAVLFSALVRLNMLFQPNSFDTMVWTFMFWVLLKYIENQENKWLYVFAVAVALGFLNKYNVVFLVLGTLAALLLSPYRNVFINKHFYLALLLAALLVAPNLWWQYTNHFPVLYHMKLLKATQLKNVETGNFLKEQMLFFFNAIFVLLAAIYALIFYKNFAKYRLFLFALVAVLGLYIYLKGKGYYAIGLYPAYMAFGAVFLENLIKNNIVKTVLLLVPLVIFSFGFKYLFPVDSPEQVQKEAAVYDDLGLTRWEDGKLHALPQDYADMLGWKELAQKVDAAYEQIGDTAHTLVYCDNYGQAGAINYYSRHAGHIGAVSFSADYLNWFDLSRPVKHIVMVKDLGDTDTTRSDERPLFQEIKYYGKIENPFAREQGTRIYILKNARTDINAILKKEIAEEWQQIHQ
ncbi:Dolichyl-phosphate-mannose-protein mannosyltransferase [Flexibacter flexilis DSM 6793]|uniref:Dolichyl-phosphate-mannose-protein mannosyltransferase n=1 Tax=Flexibacter flexilis DSM 6793 TaxID=927664 RepID=A0A1I1IR26_9BACT|nr:glycosyltransferase family 39 protein [Flexibacter flexilis]SFC38391.1 Dolichyl-phosphate-mannose-protein mannosyltransferase [Flexibacter flexilis DSM 6793]